MSEIVLTKERFAGRVQKVYCWIWNRFKMPKWYLPLRKVSSVGHILDNITRLAEAKGLTLSDLAANAGMSLEAMMGVIDKAQKRVDEGLAVGMDPIMALIEAGCKMKRN